MRNKHWKKIGDPNLRQVWEKFVKFLILLKIMRIRRKKNLKVFHKKKKMTITSKCSPFFILLFFLRMILKVSLRVSLSLKQFSHGSFFIGRSGISWNSREYSIIKIHTNRRNSNGKLIFGSFKTLKMECFPPPLPALRQLKLTETVSDQNYRIGTLL